MLPGRDVGEDADSSVRHWVKSSRSYGNGQCVEVAARSGDPINVRDSQDPLGTVLRFAPADWNVFVAGVRGGELRL
jgi:Domain of unknown function (DUF397)